MKLATIQFPPGSTYRGDLRGSSRGDWVPIAITFFSFEEGHGRGVLLPFSLDAHLPFDLNVDQATMAELPEISFSAAQLGPVIPKPGKIFCVGLNYREHIEEMGHPIPDHPTLFVKYASALAAPFADIVVPPGLQDKADYEGELAVVIGASESNTEGSKSGIPRPTIAGYTIMNDFSQRDWQYRTQQWLQGKNLDRSSGFGPWLTTADEYDPVADGAMLRTWVNGELRQEHSVADLVFKPAELVEYISNFATLEPGDVIVTGTPEGVGHGMTPPCYLAHNDEVRIAIDGLGEICNRIDTTKYPAQ